MNRMLTGIFSLMRAMAVNSQAKNRPYFDPSAPKASDKSIPDSGLRSEDIGHIQVFRNRGNDFIGAAQLFLAYE